jgi:UbiD family decarboxylase
VARRSKGEGHSYIIGLQVETAMGMIDKTQGAGAASGLDMNRYRLRTFVENLDASEKEIRSEPVDLADIASIVDGNPKTVLFKAAGPEKHEMVANVCSSRSRLAQAFGVAPTELLGELQRRLRTKPQIVEVSRAEAPVQEVVLTGDDADLTALPVHLQHGFDGAPYISATIDYVVDPKSGLSNVGIRRLMLRGHKEAGADLVAPSDLKAIYEACAREGKRLPVSFVIGAHPIDYVAAMLRLPVDETGLVASLRDAPLAVVKSVTNDIMVPADAEMVLEGYFDERGHVEPEGPYGEFLGYYGALKRNPVFHLTAITRRKDALFQTMSISGRALARTDTSQLAALRAEITVWRALETAVREPVGIYASAASGGLLNMRIAIRQRVPGEARNAIAAALGSLSNVKHVFVVDPDIDITSDEQMDWAMATRFQADKDIVVMTGLRAMPLDPSLNGSHQGAKAGFDLTWPFGTGNKLEASVPAAPRFEGKRFPSIEAALADGPKFFEELMTAVGSRDGREIVRELDRIRRSTGLTRDGDGRWIAAKA